MILHLFIDEKFIDYAITQFDKVAPSQNDFVVIIPSQDSKVKHIQQVDRVRLVVDSDENVRKLMSNLYQYDAIIFHSLFPLFSLKILYFADPSRIKLTWFFWGGEFYDHPLFINNYLGELSLKYFKKPIKYILNIGKKAVKRIIGREKYSIVKNSSKITHIVAYPEEYAAIQKQWSGHAKVMHYTYYSIEKMVGSLMNEYAAGNNIFIGNSASVTNNHLEVFERLKKIDLEGRKIIVPLSYGCAKYGKYIAERGQKIWDNDLIPLMTFMQRDEYNRCILDCSIVIMNHYRQQAIGNLVTSLWLGAKLFMSERNPMYKYFKKSGLIVFAVENDLCSENPNVFKPLTLEEKNTNREIILNHYSETKTLEYADLLVKELSN